MRRLNLFSNSSAQLNKPDNIANINNIKDGTKGFNTHKVVGVEVSREDQLPSKLTPPQNIDRNDMVWAIRCVLVELL